MWKYIETFHLECKFYPFARFCAKKKKYKCNLIYGTPNIGKKIIPSTAENIVYWICNNPRLSLKSGFRVWGAYSGGNQPFLNKRHWQWGMMPDSPGHILPGECENLTAAIPSPSCLLLPFWRGSDSTKPWLLESFWHERSAVLFSGCSSDYWQTKDEQAAESTPLVST